jgi:hypothetical protein
MTVGLLGLTAAAAIAFCSSAPVHGQGGEPEKKLSEPKFVTGHDLRVRQGGKPDFDKDTPRVGVEIYHHEPTNAFIGISEAGYLAVTPAGQIGADKTCKWLTALDLSVRKAGEKDFTQKTKKFGVELFRDFATNRLLYVCESGSLAFAPVTAGLVTDKGPKWSHAFEPRVRAFEQVTFDNAKKMGLEVSKDENSGELIYITEVGGIAAGPSPAQARDPKAPVLSPVYAYGLNLRVRGASEKNFNDKTKKVGVEVFEDPHANNQFFFISETGSVSVTPNPGKLSDVKGVTWKVAMTLKARKGGEKTFEGAPQFGIEVFTDNRTGNLIFICETGSIAVLPKP